LAFDKPQRLFAVRACGHIVSPVVDALTMGHGKTHVKRKSAVDAQKNAGMIAADSKWRLI
jgi:hypothetical protein